MAINSSRISDLFERFYNKTATDAEREELMSWVSHEATDEELARLARHSWDSIDADPARMAPAFFGEDKGEQMLAHILQARSPEREKPAPVRKLYRWNVVAAAAIVAVVLATVWLLRPAPAPSKDAEKPLVAAANITPGADKAMLTLADGSSIVLDSAPTGVIGQQGRATISKATNGHLVYAAGRTGDANAGINSIATPRGGQYQVTLADGSKVWLNAASSLRFPATFAGAKREVELTGEGYFEIASDPSRPFVVKLADATTVKVLGTRFDVMAYSDETLVRTTLLQGAVKVEKRDVSQLLRPGQQAQLAAGSASIRVLDEPDADAAIAWKNGLFQFDRADIHTIMRQIARWYDVDVRYDGTLPERTFVGKVPRNASVAQVLHILELSHIHFRIEGRTIIVLP